MFRALGAQVLEADAIARELMQPGQPVYTAIVAKFDTGVVRADGQLDRTVLARMAFGEGRIEELNAIVHPATIARQQEIATAIAAREPEAVLVVESALIFETKYGETKYGETKYGETGGWSRRFDKLVLVTAPEELKVARYVARVADGRLLTVGERTAFEDEAYRRLAQQIPDEQKASLCDYVLTNEGSLQELEWQVEQLWPLLVGQRTGNA